MVSIHIETVEERSLPGVVADEIVASIQEAVDDRGACFLSLSGGSTPASIYRMLGRPPRVHDIAWDKVHIFWGDERWVPKDDNQSNYRMTEETLLCNISIPEENLHCVNTSLGSPEAGAKAYEETIKSTLGSSNNETPKFDIVLLGIGTDGHTASLFPGGDELSSSKLCVASTQPETGTERVSFSLELIKNSRKLFFIARGQAKADIVQAALESDKPVIDIPARVFAEASGKVVWFLDSAAAKKLSS